MHRHASQPLILYAATPNKLLRISRRGVAKKTHGSGIGTAVGRAAVAMSRYYNMRRYRSESPCSPVRKSTWGSDLLGGAGRWGLT